MSQVTIYLDDETLDAAKAAATRAGISLSRWFARFAEDEKVRRASDRAGFWAEIDRLREAGGDADWDFLLGPDRDSDLGRDSP